MLNKYIAQYREFEKGKNGFMVDIALFTLITYSFHLIFRFYASAIMSVPFIQASAEWLAYAVYTISLWINQHILGMQIVVKPVNAMWFTNGAGIYVNNSCSGLKQFYQVIILFVLFPGPWRSKLWFIPFSCFVMFATNVFRIVVLSVNQSFHPEYFEFIHTWVLRPFFYVVLFGLWVWWVEKYRRRGVVKTGNEQTTALN
jgi:exosortase/archaeosortase family protein